MAIKWLKNNQETEILAKWAIFFVRIHYYLISNEFKLYNIQTIINIDKGGKAYEK